MSSADAVQREADWLSGAAITSGTTGQTLPALVVAQGGLWDVVQAYVPRTSKTTVNRIYVTRARLQSHRVAMQRVRNSHDFRLKLYWKIGSTTQAVDIAEQEQQALDNAVEDLLLRIRAFRDDHTHGGRFLSVAEADGRAEIDVQYGDPEVDIPAGILTASVTYSADDPEIVT